MSEGSPPLHLAGVSANGSESNPLSRHLPKVDALVETKFAKWLAQSKVPASLQTRLTEASWTVEQWGKTLFATSSTDLQAPALLVYLPEPPAQAKGGRRKRSVQTPTTTYNMAAVLTAWAAWQEVNGDALVTLKLLSGPLDEGLLTEHAPVLAADAIIYALGEYTGGRPLVSLGLKGLLEVELRAKTLSQSASSAYSEVMPAASWVIVRALDALKSDVQEVKIDYFEQNIAPLPAQESRLLLAAVPQHRERLARQLQHYGLSHYIFELKDALVLQTEYRVPTVNVSAIECGSFNEAGRLKLPAMARAWVDLHLVPDQTSAQIFQLLYNYLTEKNFDGLEVIQLPGSLEPTRTPLDNPFVALALATSEAVTGQPPLLAPISPYTGPLAMLKAAAGQPPAICIGLDENATRQDGQAHAKFLAHLLPEIASLRFETLPELSFELPPDIFEVSPDELPPSIFEASSKPLGHA